MPVKVDRDRLWSMMEAQGEFGGAPGMPGALRRGPLTDADKRFRDWLVDHMEDEGLDVRIDEMGNIFGRRDGTDSDAAPVLTGSHGDSYGGKFDGVLGVVGALEVVKTLNDHDIETRRPIEIVDWTNEESSRFDLNIISSGVWAGVHEMRDMYDLTDEDGNRFEDELRRIGYRGDVPAEPREEYHAYVELHIEQGPYLEQMEKDVGVVTDIAGYHRGEITYYGESTHPGGTPMAFRRDPVVAAADTIAQIRRLPGVLGERTVSTVSRIDVEPNNIRFIADEASFTWDLRDPRDEVVDRGVDRILEEAEWAATREHLDWEWTEIHSVPSVTCAETCVSAVQTAADELGYDSVQMPSMALHDANHVANVVDTSMIFAVSEDGKSHNPDEYTSPEDCYKAVNTLTNAVLELGNT